MCVCARVCAYVCVCACVRVRVRMESGHETSYELASSPGPAQKSEKGRGHTGKNSVCAVSAVFVWSRGTTFVHYQLLRS